jgi:hypothetical protein
MFIFHFPSPLLRLRRFFFTQTPLISLNQATAARKKKKSIQGTAKSINKWEIIDKADEGATQLFGKKIEKIKTNEIHVFRKIPRVAPSLGGNDVGVTNVSDRQDGRAELAAAGSAKIDVVSAVVVNGRLGEHGVVLKLGLADWWAVVGNNDELGAALAEGRERLAEAKAVLARLHDELDLRVDRVHLRLALLHHFWSGTLERKLQE